MSFTITAAFYRSILSIMHKSKGPLHAVISSLFLLGILLTAPAGVWAATPVGTVITNTAAASFSVNGIGGFNAVSNNDQFAVQALGASNTAVMNIIQTPAGSTPSAGDTLSFDINITNTGDNNLSAPAFKVSAPAGSSISLSSGMLAPSLAGPANYSLSDISPSQTLSIQFDLTLSPDLAPGAQTLGLELTANGQSIINNQIDFTIKSRSNAVMEVLRYDPEASGAPLEVSVTEYFDGSSYLGIPVPTLPDNVTLITDAPLPLSPASEFTSHETLFLKISDSDHDRDPLAKETIEITFNVNGSSETEVIRLKETAVNSGVFSGYLIMSHTPGNGHDGSLNVDTNSRVTVTYADEVENSLSQSIILVDPFGIVFDSLNGIALNGVTVRLVNAATGLDAEVYGDDGISTYPATLTSGGTATDSSGTVYDFETGAYRFPLIAPGEYYLEVTAPPPSGYHYPSFKSDAELAQTPGGPFAIELGSRGETFTITAGPPLHLDIPLDPPSSVLYVERSASKDSLEQGDFLQYRVTVENVSTLIDANSTILTDTLPRGFRYKEGSSKLDQLPSADPQLSPDGRTLSYTLGDIATGVTRTVTYVIEAGAAKPGEAPSSSIATSNDGAIVSNTSTVKTLVSEAFMRLQNILMGRVLVHDDTGNPTGEGIAGVRIYMQDGRYSVTDEKGRYHFEGIASGTHVLQLDLDTLPKQYEAMAFERNTRFAGRAWSQFVDLHGGTLWRADFHARKKPAPTGHLRLDFNHDELLDGDHIRYRFTLHNQTVALSNIRLVVMLPQETRYLQGSSTFAGKGLDEPQQQENMLTYTLGDIPGDFKGDITLTANIAAPLKNSIIAKAMLTFDTPTQKSQRSDILEDIIEHRIQESEEGYRLRLQFDSFSDTPKETELQKLEQLANTLKNAKGVHISAVGYSDDKQVRSRSYHLYSHNQALSQKRAQSVADLLKEKLQLMPEQISVIGRGVLNPIGDNATEEGRAANRRVELFVTATAEKTYNPKGGETSKGRFETETLGTRPEGTTPQKTVTKTPQDAPALYDGAWLSTAQPGIEWLLPEIDDLPAIASIDIALKHHKGQSIRLLLNDRPVPEANFESEESNRAGVAISRWKGVDLVEGDNRLSAVITDEAGRELKRLSRSVHYSSPPVHAELVKEESLLIADGMTPPVIALRLRDRYDFPARRHIIGEYSLNAPYLPRKTTDFDPAVLPGSPQKKLQYTVEKDGLVKITLEPTSQSGEVQLTLPLMNGDKVVKAHLNAPKRDWVIVGFAEGTIGHNTLSGKTEDLDGNSAEKDIYSDGKVAFFAKGRVKGEWLLTMAYDSEKETGEKDSSLFQTIDPKKYYTVYGDTSSQGFEAASREKLYLKLERDAFYFLFGDYNTNLSGTRLSSYTRALTGVKSQYHDETYDVILFGSESNQAFIHDEIRGKGMTGPYRLSRQNILLNSEKIVIETRDRFHSENVLESRELARHSDYQIDYVNGTVTFRKTVYEHDSGLNNVFIVAKYESFDEDDLSLTYGGRVASKVTSNIEVGVTHVNEGKTGGEAELTGADATLNITGNTLLRAEVAQSKQRNNSADNDGSAFLAEIEHRGDNLNAKAYARKTQKDFGIGQNAGAENGTEKMGVDSSYRLNEYLSLSGSAFEQKDTQTKAKRDVVEAKTNLQVGDSNFNVGARTARDTRGNGTKEQSDQITLGASRRMLDNSLTLSVDHEHSMGSADNIDYPTLTRVNADYLLSKKSSLFAQHEWADGSNRKTENTQLGLKTTPWSGGSLFSGITHTQGTGNDTTSANTALEQTWKINELWSMDFGAEKSKTLRSESPPLQNGVPYAHGSSSDYTAGSVGVTYNPETWVWNARIEQRNSDLDDSWLAATSVQTDPSSETSLLTSLRLYDSRAVTGNRRNDGELRLDLAYRPLMGPWIILDKLQLIKETVAGGDFDYENRRIVNHTNANYLAVNRWQLALQLGVKYVQETIDQTAYNGVTNLYGAEARYDITDKWDIGTNVSMLHSVENSQYDGLAGVSVGHSFMDNVWVSLGYNFTGFYDRDFSQGRSTSQGVFLKFRIKIDQQSATELKEWLKQ